MRHEGTSGWASAWAALLMLAVIWVALDHSAADQMIDAVIRRWDINRFLASGFLVFGVLNLFALALRIVTWRNE